MQGFCTQIFFRFRFLTFLSLSVLEESDPLELDSLSLDPPSLGSFFALRPPFFTLTISFSLPDLLRPWDLAGAAEESDELPALDPLELCPLDDEVTFWSFFSGVRRLVCDALERDLSSDPELDPVDEDPDSDADEPLSCSRVPFEW